MTTIVVIINGDPRFALWLFLSVSAGTCSHEHSTKVIVVVKGRLLNQVELHSDWLLPPPFHYDLRLESHAGRILWQDVSIRWCEDWQSAAVMNFSLVCDPQ